MHLPKKKRHIFIKKGKSIGAGLVLKRNYSSLIKLDQLPMPLKHYSKLMQIFRYVLKFYFILIFYIRSFFISEKSFHLIVYLTPLISIIFITLTPYFPAYLTNFLAFRLSIMFGTLLIVYDGLGSYMSNHVLTDLDPIISVTYLIKLSKTNKQIIRHVAGQSLMGLVIGKTNMTATGRAALVGAAFTGSAWLYNATKERQAAAARSAAARAEARHHATQQAKIDLYQIEVNAYKDRPWHSKGKPPTPPTL